MKRFSIVAIFCTAVFLLGIPFLVLAQATGVLKMKTYHHIQGFSLQIPSSWAIRENLDFQGFKIPLIVLEPLQGTADDFQENINVIGEKTASPYQVEEYLQANVKTMSKTLNSFHSIKADDLNESKRGGKYLIYTHKVDQVKEKVKVIVFFYTKGTKAYSLTCSSTERDFSRYLSLFMKIGKSFQWIGS